MLGLSKTVNTLYRWFIVGGVALACGCQSTAPGPSIGAEPADIIYENGRVYTVDTQQPWVDALALRGDTIVALGSSVDIESFRAPSTKIVDLGGRMVMPGIHDMHIHPLDAGITGVFECSFPSSSTMNEILDVVADCVSKQPAGDWILGGQWPTALLDSKTVPHRDLLDAITDEHPIWLMDWAVHNAWVNSKALQMLGIDDETLDPEGGKIVRDPQTGKATGVLLDNAAYAAQRRLPAYTHEQYVTAARWSIDQMVSFGITSFKDAIATTENLNAYRELDKRLDLKARAHTCLAWKSAWSKSHEEELANLQQREKYRSDLLTTDCAKIMLDGIPVEYTSALLEPYAPSPDHAPGFRGELMFGPEDLSADVVALDAMGLTIKIHATGDWSARVAMDAFEAARANNPTSTAMHEVSHAQLIHPDDLDRFRDLNVAAEMCPILWYPGPSDGARNSALGADRAGRFWPVKSLLEAGAHVFYGSDWPAVVPTASPWPGIEAMVSRRNPYDSDYPGQQWPEQAIDLTQTLRIFTINGAIAGRSEHKTGSLAVGKAADFIVLDRNLFEIPVEDISETNILKTVVGGQVVYQHATTRN